MVQPNLIHGVPIEITVSAPSTTVFDEDAHEPVQQADKGTPVIVRGVPNWMVVGGGEGYTPQKGGFTADTLGYILFRYIDLDAAGVTLKHNDRFTKIGTRPYDLFINRLAPMGHYTDMNGPSLVRAYFVDREPSKMGVR
jgi:hypothetical protein